MEPKQKKNVFFSITNLRILIEKKNVEIFLQVFLKKKDSKISTNAGTKKKKKFFKLFFISFSKIIKKKSKNRKREFFAKKD